MKSPITETRLINGVFVITPWVTPLITAWLVYDATRELLDWGALQAAVGAAIIEVNGLASIALVLWLYRERAARWLVILAMGLVGVYCLTILGLTVVLGAYPQYAYLTPVLFVALVLSSNAGLALRGHHKSVMAQRRATKAQPTADPLPQPVPEPLPAKRNGTTARERIVVLLRNKPEAAQWSSEQIGEAVGVTGARVRKIATKNGNGWAV
jgi:hypothetical protein